jgi:hypothetical protein
VGKNSEWGRPHRERPDDQEPVVGEDEDFGWPLPGLAT